MTFARPDGGADPGRVGPVALVAVAVASGLLAAVLSTRPSHALVAAIGVPFVFLTSLRTKMVVYFAVLAVVGWVKVHYPATSVQGVPEILAYVLLGQLLFELLTRHGRLPVRRGYVIAVALYATLVVVQSQNPIITRVGASSAGARTYLAPLILFPIGLYLLRDPRNARAFLKVGIVAAVVVGLYMIKQLVVGFDHAERTFHLERVSLVVTEQKLFSTTTAPDVYGFVTAFFVLLCLTARTARVWPRLATWTAVLSAVGVVASGLRVSGLGVVLAGGLLLAVQLSQPQARALAFRTIVIGVAVVSVLVALVVATPVRPREQIGTSGSPLGAAVEKLALLKQGSQDDDYHGRAVRVGRFVTYMKAHPWGAGPGLPGLLSQETVTEPGHEKPSLPEYLFEAPFLFQHDFYYFNIGSELGLIGLVLFPAMLVWGLALGVRAARRHEDETLAWSVAGLAAATALLALVQNLTNESFRTPQVAGIVWFLLAAPVAITARGESRSTPEATTPVAVS